MTYLVFQDGEWVEVDKPNKGDRYRKIGNDGSMVESYWLDPEVDERAVYILRNELVSVNGQAASKFAGNYYCEPNDTISLSGEIVDGDHIVESINIPVTLKMPLIRFANGQPTQDEIYLNVTLTNGLLTAQGVIPWSGDWKLIIERNNEAIRRIGANWKLQHEDVSFLA